MKISKTKKNWKNSDQIQKSNKAARVPSRVWGSARPYYNASEKDRTFVEAVARKNYGLKQAHANGKAASTVAPFFGIHRAG